MAAPIVDHQAPLLQIVDQQAPQRLPTLTDELLEDIFLRLPTPTDLARASTACASFRRIITDRSFLRRFRAFHAPPLLGFVNSCGFHAAEASHPSAPLARALARAADFSYSFVPRPYGVWGPCWSPCDVRDGRVLLECNYFGEGEDVSTNLAVCDPLARRYVLLPSIPEDLTAQHERPFYFENFLAPTGEDDETSFRVICTGWNTTTLFPFIFTSITGQWHLAASSSFSSLGLVAFPRRYYQGFTSFQVVWDCIYWLWPYVDKFLVLDTLSMELSIVNNVSSCNLRWDDPDTHVMSSEHGTPLLFFLSDHDDASGCQLHITKMNVSEPADQWKLEKIIPLPRQYSYSTFCADEGFIFLCGIPKEHQISVYPCQGYPFRDYFAFDIKTSELKKICGKKRDFSDARPYFGFPPSLTEPCI